LPSSSNSLKALVSSSSLTSAFFSSIVVMACWKKEIPGKCRSRCHDIFSAMFANFSANKLAVFLKHNVFSFLHVCIAVIRFFGKNE
jgi:hypothetical protein